MYSENGLEEFFFLIALAVLFIVAIVLFLVFISNLLINYNNKKAIETDRKIARQIDKNLIVQAKNNIQKPVIKEKGDFDVNFDINLTGSVVKTEVVYID